MAKLPIKHSLVTGTTLKRKVRRFHRKEANEYLAILRQCSCVDLYREQVTIAYLYHLGRARNG